MTSESGESKDKRKFVRVPYNYVIRYSKLASGDDPAGKKQEGVVNDISGGGLSFLSKQRFEVGDVIELEIEIPDWEKYKPGADEEAGARPSRPFVAKGRVTKATAASENKHNIGVVFEGLGRDDQWALMKAITYQF